MAHASTGSPTLRAFAETVGREKLVPFEVAIVSLVLVVTEELVRIAGMASRVIVHLAGRVQPVT